MNTRFIYWATLLTVILVAGAVLVYQGRNALPAGADTSELEESFVSGRCEKAEEVDRWLLQQTWFHDPAFASLAGVFGNHSFGLYDQHDPLNEVEGAFCIDGNDLMVRYYERSFVPVAADLTKLSVKFGVKLSPMHKDVFTVRELSKDKMVLVFASDSREHVFYRKH